MFLYFQLLLCTFCVLSSSNGYLLDQPINVYSHDCLTPPACKGCGYFWYSSPIHTLHDYLITCNKAQLSTFPVVKPITITQNSVIVDFSENFLTYIQGNVFSNVNIQGHPKVTVKMNVNAISSIDDNAFNGIAEYITSLDLSNNLLVNISSAFGTLRNLKSLFLSLNPLSHVDGTAVLSFGHSLTNLEFDLSHLPSWPSPFSNLTALKNLKIGRMDIELNDSNIFDGFADSLQSLSLLYLSQDNGPYFRVIPAAITHLHVLDRLTIGGEVYCTCNLAYLKHWKMPGFIKADGSYYLACHGSDEHFEDYINRTLGHTCH